MSRGLGQPRPELEALRSVQVVSMCACNAGWHELQALSVPVRGEAVGGSLWEQLPKQHQVMQVLLCAAERLLRLGVVCGLWHGQPMEGVQVRETSMVEHRRCLHAGG